jgi:hypothetical protein
MRDMLTTNDGIAIFFDTVYDELWYRYFSSEKILKKNEM